MTTASEGHRTRFQTKPSTRAASALPRAGISLVELLISMSIMGMMAAGIGALAVAVQMSSEYARSNGTAVQHARVAIERIERAINEANATADFPGFAVFSEQVGPWEFPDTLVVWRPDGEPANPDGPPLVSELVVFCPDPADPSHLLEITVPNDNRPAPPLDNQSIWINELTAIKSSPDAQRVTLTNLLRAPVVWDDATSAAVPRGAVRFEAQVRPSQQDWADFRSGTLAWNDVPWAQSIHGSRSGLRQSRCSIELQLLPDIRDADAAAPEPIAFFGSAAVYYQLQQGNGLKAYWYYNTGSHSALAGIDWNSPDATSIEPEVNFAETTGPWFGGAPTNYFAARFVGKIDIPADGTWTLYLNSDDGSKLWIDGRQVVDNDGTHSIRERSGAVDLTAGQHGIEIKFFERWGSAGLIAEWKGPDVGKEVIPMRVLSTGY